MKLRYFAIALLLCQVFVMQAQAQVAFDAFSNPAAEFTDDAGGTWAHTPVGTPKALICFVMRASGGAGATDTVVGITADGNALTEMSGSPILQDGADDDLVVHGFFKGSGIPAEELTIIVDVNAAVAHHAGCVTLTAAADTEIVDVDASINSESDDNPAVTLSLSSRTSFAMIGFGGGHSVVNNITPFANWTGRLEWDGGAATAGIYTYDTIGTTDVSAGWTQTAENAAMIAVAVSEVAASAGGVPSGLTLLGVGQ